MKDFFSKYGGILIFFIISVGIGLFIGLKMNPEGGNIYCQFSIGKDKQFSLGKNSILDFDLKQITDEEAAALIEKIKKLPFTHYLSNKLRFLCDNGKCIFKKEEKELVVRFINNENISGKTAGACREKMPYGKRICIFNILSPGIQKKIKDRMMDFDVVVEMSRSECKVGSNYENTIWIDTEKGQKLIGLENGSKLPDKLLVKATILSTIIQ